jgi:GTP cyclohydrolase I
MKFFAKGTAAMLDTHLVPRQKKLKKDEKKELIAYHFRQIMETLGLDLNDPSLAKTPDRVAKMYVDEIFSGLDPSTFPDISMIDNVGSEKAMVMTKATFHSTCEHHFVPMSGEAYIAYIPKNKLIGLSKVPRIVRFFAKRPQVQERLTSQISECLMQLLETEDVAVSTNLEHTCVKARGIEDRGSLTTVNVFQGAFRDDPVRQQEFLLSRNEII